MKRIFMAFSVIALCISSCNNRPTTASAPYITEEPAAEEPIVEKSNKEKIIETMREAITAYRNASSEEEIKQIDAAVKTKVSAIQENCTVKELREINQDEEYNKVWKECMRTIESTMDALGLLDEY